MLSEVWRLDDTHPLPPSLSFFAAFQGAKYLAITTRGVHDELNTVGAMCVAAAPLGLNSVTRAYVPYAVMLVAIDAFNEAGYNPTNR